MKSHGNDGIRGNLAEKTDILKTDKESMHGRLSELICFIRTIGSYAWTDLILLGNYPSQYGYGLQTELR